MNEKEKTEAIEWIREKMVYAQWCILGYCEHCAYKGMLNCKRELVTDLTRAHAIASKMIPMVCKVRPVKKSYKEVIKKL